MGCDIHMFVEYKVGDKPWEADKNHKEVEEDDYRCVEEFPFDARDYQVFGLLAGVRRDGPDAKGLPEDVSGVIAKAVDLYGSDGHSHSWTSFKDYKVVLQEVGFNLKNLPFEVEWTDDTSYEERWAAGTRYIQQQIFKFKMDLEAEKMLLGDQDINTDVDARVVYFFDN